MARQLAGESRRRLTSTKLSQPTPSYSKDGAKLTAPIIGNHSVSKNDPIIWITVFNGSRGAHLSLWRAGEMELEFADFDTDESIAPEHFHSKDGLRDAVTKLSAWISVDAG
ncbi:MAG TPA: hypothetical protein VGH89_00285 [Pseudonocardia sp.]